MSLRFHLIFPSMPVGFAGEISKRDHEVIYELPLPPPVFQSWKQSLYGVCTFCLEPQVFL